RFGGRQVVVLGEQAALGVVDFAAGGFELVFAGGEFAVFCGDGFLGVGEFGGSGFEGGPALVLAGSGFVELVEGGAGFGHPLFGFGALLLGGGGGVAEHDLGF